MYRSFGGVRWWGRKVKVVSKNVGSYHSRDTMRMMSVALAQGVELCKVSYLLRLRAGAQDQ